MINLLALQYLSTGDKLYDADITIIFIFNEEKTWHFPKMVMAGGRPPDSLLRALSHPQTPQGFRHLEAAATRLPHSVPTTFLPSEAWEMTKVTRRG